MLRLDRNGGLDVALPLDGRVERCDRRVDARVAPADLELERRRGELPAAVDAEVVRRLDRA